MKREQLVWLLAVTAGATPILEFGQGSRFDYDGLRFAPDRKFEITVFSDLHMGEEFWGGDCTTYDAATLNVMNGVLERERTDLAVLNGDLLTGEAFEWDPSNNHTRFIDKIVQPFVSRNIPWASTYGNHDRSPWTDPRAMLEKEKSYNNGASKKRAWVHNSVPGEDGKVGSSNYFIPIYSSSGGGNPNLAMILWFFDSRSGASKEKAMNEDFVAPEVVAWFNAQKTEIRKSYNRVIPSLAFVHIPFKAAADLREDRKKDTSFAPGIDDELVGHQACPGDNCVYNGKDIPFTKALVETEGLMAVFSGHDHKLDWCTKWSNDKRLPNTEPPTGNGLNVCFGRRTGYGGYSKYFRKGARKIRIYEDELDQRELDTWVRLEDGYISGSITLNSTYGIDRYPAAPDQDKKGVGKFLDINQSTRKPDIPLQSTKKITVINTSTTKTMISTTWTTKVGVTPSMMKATVTTSFSRPTPAKIF